MNIFGRLSWFITFLIPALTGIAIAIWGLNSDLPRGYFVVGFLFALVIMPGILVWLKVMGTPLQEEEIILLGAGSGDQVKIARPSGGHDIVSHSGIKRAILTGELRIGARLHLVRRGDIVIDWKLLE